MTAVFFGGCLVVTLFLSVSVHIDAPHDSHGACSYLVFKGGVRDRVVDGRISLLWISLQSSLCLFTETMYLYIILP
ncbi:hypothetical protein BO99DRAFT_133838 [Aspergillus violaceofuscus CBS 115571]|uniref:Uncharacterized protein n=1 Tax=Aspergillus violaceofuscus (strain CBS 115571) TaxID=1450538 RepID=A0A2V5HU46_ASPV1|nr:hypothetical protein BO99DRAFT_133838 [Aspergillus violaceofuscus CBS 115571]